MDTLFMEYTISELSILNQTNEYEYYGEGAVYNVLDDILTFIQRIVNDLVSFGKKLKNDVDSLIQKKEVRAKLKKLKEELKEKTDEDVKKVSMIDVEEFIRYYNRYENKITKKINVLSRGNFKTKGKMEAVILDIENDLDEMNNVLQDTLEKRIVVPINKAISYVEDNLNGTNEVEKKFVETTHALKEISINAERVIKNSSLSSDEDLKKEYVAGIKKVTKKISNVFSKWFQKFVMSVVFFFA